MGPFSNIKGLSYYANNDEDPYITLKDVGCLLTHTRR
jgi:periodic tryptophan protein 1